MTKIGGAAGYSLRRAKLRSFLRSDPSIPIGTHEETNDLHSGRNSNASVGSPIRGDESLEDTDSTTSNSPYLMSPYNKSPWILGPDLISSGGDFPRHGLIGSLVREEGHVYSLAASGGLLYTGSESNNIRVWKNMEEFSGFKSNSRFVKAIVISGQKILTGHQDGKIRVWKFSPKNHRKPYRLVRSLPRTKDYIKSSFNPRNYVEVRRRRRVPWIKHFDAVSCLSLDEDQGLLYSGSWDKTLKVWRISDSKCLESVKAHDDAINSVVAGFQGFVFTGSADGTVKVWRRELLGRISKHVLVRTLMKQESAVTALAVNADAAALYCGSSDGLVNFWERERHLSHGGILRGHKTAVLCLAAAGNLVFSGSADKSICVWRRGEGGDHTCLSVLTGHGGPVKCLAVQEDDQEPSDGDQRWILFSGSLDRSVKVWRVSEQAPDLK